MEGVLGGIIVGIICIGLGITNMLGNISLLHSYHRKRVKEEDVKPFGKLVGIGTIIIGVSLIAMGVLEWCAISLSSPIYRTIGYVALGVGLVVGIVIIFYAMKKYNKGIF